MWYSFVKIGPGTAKIWWTEKKIKKINNTTKIEQSLAIAIAIAGDCNNVKRIRLLCRLILITTQKLVRHFNGLTYHFVEWYAGGQMAYRLRRHWSAFHKTHSYLFKNSYAYDLVRSSCTVQ